MMEQWLSIAETFVKDKVYLEWLWILIYVFIILVLTILVARLFDKIYNQFIQNFTSKIRSDPTGYQFISHLLRAVIYLLGFGIAVATIPALAPIAAPLFAGTGILAVAVGFASQHAFSNLISGLFIVLFRPFGVHDHLFIDKTTFGIVEDITLRHTILRSPENRRIVVPNSLMSSKVIVNSHLNDERVCKFIEASVAYDTDMDLAIEVLRELVGKHPNCLDNRTLEEIENGGPKVMVKVLLLEDSSVRLRAWAWTANNSDAFNMTCDLNQMILKRFAEEGIDIPYPHRTVINKK